MADSDWLCGFLKIHAEHSIRKCETSKISRAVRFASEYVKNYTDLKHYFQAKNKLQATLTNIKKIARDQINPYSKIIIINNYSFKPLRLVYMGKILYQMPWGKTPPGATYPRGWVRCPLDKKFKFKYLYYIVLFGSYQYGQVLHFGLQFHWCTG